MRLFFTLILVKPLLRFIFPFDVTMYLVLKISDIQSVYLYAAGELGIETYFYLNAKGFKVNGWFDKQADTNDHSVLAKPIQPLSLLSEIPDDQKIVICSEEYRYEIKEYLLQQGLAPTQLIS